MPAGTSWTRYIFAAAGAMLSMFAGAQTVHMLYHPLEDLNARVELEKEALKRADRPKETTVVAVTTSSPS